MILLIHAPHKANGGLGRYNLYVACVEQTNQTRLITYLLVQNHYNEKLIIATFFNFYKRFYFGGKNSHEMNFFNQVLCSTKLNMIFIRHGWIHWRESPLESEKKNRRNRKQKIDVCLWETVLFNTIYFTVRDDVRITVLHTILHHQHSVIGWNSVISLQFITVGVQSVR